MPLIALGVNHRTAPLEVRERLAFGREEIPDALAELVNGGVCSEAAILSTCNRTEVYLVAGEGSGATGAVQGVLAERARLSPEQFSSHLYIHRDRSAADHLFRVAAGLDSMVLGEPQIQGQVKEGYELARGVVWSGGGATGPVLNRLFETALSVGGRVRSETELGRGAASVPSAAVDLAKKIFGSLAGRRALVLGAGETSEVTVECLRSEGVGSCIVTNRTYDRAVEVARRCGGRAAPWEDLARELRAADIVICSTAAPHAVLSLDAVRSALPGGAARPLCIVDIAIPRDVDPRVGEEPNVFLYNIDDLRQIVDANLSRRAGQLPRAEAIIASGVADYWRWYASLAVVPTIRELRARGESVRQQEVEKTLRRLSHLPAEDQAAIDALTRALVNKLLHEPTVRLRDAAGNGRGTRVIDSLRYLFDLDEAERTDREADAEPERGAGSTEGDGPGNSEAPRRV